MDGARSILPAGVECGVDQEAGATQVHLQPVRDLDVQVFYVEGVVFDEFAAFFYVFAH
jgi:hypothetical protein